MKYLQPEPDRNLFDGHDYEFLRTFYNGMMPVEQPALLYFEQLNPIELWVSEMIQGGNLLDVGCANARFLLYLAVNGRIEYGTGIDISDEMIANAQKGTSAHSLKNLSFIRGEFENLTFADYYNYISMNDILEHFYSPFNVIERIPYLLESNGQFVGMVPYWKDCDHRVHLHYFTPESLRELLSNFFKDITIKVFECYPGDRSRTERKIAWRAKI